MAPVPEYLRLRAKFDGSGDFHPLICHLVDVAAVAETVWDVSLGDSARRLIGDGLGLGTSAARAWVAFLAGIHDLGKASPPFQSKDKSAIEALPGLGLNPALKDPGHGLVTAAFLPNLLPAPIDWGLRDRLARVTGGHHGVFAGAKVAKVRDAAGPEIGERDGRWTPLRGGLYQALAEVLTLPAAAPSGLPNAAALALAGFISVVDWIGSMSDRDREGKPVTNGFFPWLTKDEREDFDLTAYSAKARDQATCAVGTLHWRSPAPPGLGTFSALFPGVEPRPLQAAVARKVWRGADVEPPRLAIIEAPMGEGKTEAAFSFVDAWLSRGVRGAYVAMPTMATSDQMYSRFLAYAMRRFEVETIPVMLAHGHASLAEGLARLDDTVEPGATYDGGSPEEERKARLGVAEWFTHRKRPLLAYFGVGTIDQALMSVLQVKHNAVRLFGLTGKAVLIDEVHAYDTYMSTLLERLLEWLGALGSPVALLSATLPSGRRRALIEAYHRGLVGAGDATVEAAWTSVYPRISWLDAGGLVEEEIATSDEITRVLQIDAIGADDDALVAALRARLTDGGCAAVICNTVASAQKVYQLLRASAALTFDDGRGLHVELFHARFVWDDRKRIQDRVLEHYGKQSDATAAGYAERHAGCTELHDDHGRPRRSVVVATQVIEQSLDLDFDVMFSDPAPVDLLLQRSGRLHRHSGRERPNSGGAVLQVRWGPDLSEAPVFDSGTEHVYAPYVLLRTWDALRRHGATVRVPEDVEALIEDVYVDDLVSEAATRVPEGVDEGRWGEALAKLRDEDAGAEYHAKVVAVDEPWLDVPMVRWTELQLSDDDDERVHQAFRATTRLAEPSVNVVVLEAGDSALTTKTAPGRKGVRRLLGRSLTVTRRELVEALLAQLPPGNWKDSAWLRHHRRVELGADGAGTVGRFRVSYDSSVGLTFTKDGEAH